MSSSDPGPDREEQVRLAASDWWSRLQHPHGDAERREFEAWRAADRLHAEAFDRLAALWETAPSLRFREIGRARNLEEAFRPGPRRWWWLAAAAALVLTLGGVGILTWRSAGPGAGGERTLALAGASNEVRHVALADGSHVILDRGAQLRVTIDPNARRLRLVRGRARFDVAHEGRPFIVEADGERVIAHGTLFDVSLSPQGVKVVLLRGSVEVQRIGAAPNDPRGPASRFLAPGERVVVPVAGPIPPPQRASADAENWTEPLLEFDSTPLSSAVNEINRESATKITLARPELGARRITGAFRAGDAEGFARSMAAALDLDLTREPDGKIVLSASPQT